MSAKSLHVPVVLHRAPWVLPVASSPIHDGCIAVQGERIVAVGSWKRLSSLYKTSRIHLYSGVLMPGLINGHTHLELSFLGTVTPTNPDATMCDWIRSLLKRRKGTKESDEFIVAAAGKCAQEQFEDGVVALIDIGNASLAPFQGNVPEIYPLLELLGHTSDSAEQVIKKIDALSSNTHITAHAPYSVTPKLLKTIKAATVSKKSLFSLHICETPDESLLLLEGKGCFFSFLQERETIDSTFPLKDNVYRSVVDYLFKIGLLDDKTLCVHSIYVDKEDISLMARAKNHICLCPCSNAFLGFDKAPLELMLAAGIVPAIGTDSRASNPKMSMWQEFTLLRKNHPTVAPEKILEMATIAGAKAMGREDDFGTIEVGKKFSFIAVEDREIGADTQIEEVMEILTTKGQPENIIWPHLQDISGA